jgi:hypothetical protein
MLKLETQLYTKEGMKKVVADLWKVIEKHPVEASVTLSAEEMHKVHEAWVVLDTLYTDTFDEEY